MKLRQLRYLTAVVEAGTITEAARRLHVTQPALSAGLASLEEELGGVLLYRERDGVRLTPTGMQFHRRALKILREVTAAKSEFETGRKGGILRIGVVPSVRLPMILSFLRVFEEAAPDMEVSLRESNSAELSAMLDSGRLDAALLPFAATNGQEWVPLFSEELVLLCAPSHPLAKAEIVRAADLDGQNFVLRNNCEIAPETCKRIRARGIKPRVVLKTDQDDKAVEAVRAGLGATIATGGASEFLVARPLEDFGPAPTFGLRIAPTLDPSSASLLVEIWRKSIGTNVRTPEDRSNR